MIWSEGITRYDIAITLRLLERKFYRVESDLYIYRAQDDFGALGDVSPCYDTADQCERNMTRLASFQVRIAPDPGWAHDDEEEGVLLHELVHVAQMERRGLGRPPTSDWLDAHVDGDGNLDRSGSIAYYRIFPYEREAKALEIGLVFRPANRDYWRGILAGSAG